ncbi:LysR family transcriptional regulator [Thioclava sp. BHET1]|nr:LysR family transcriptional regulator [Thioclava sp. BHET1]
MRVWPELRGEQGDTSFGNLCNARSGKAGLMEMHQVRYFLAVARLLNFTRAAEACNVSQPALTRAIQKLEEELGGPLFHRERAQTHLTPLGRSLEPHLDQLFGAAEAAKRTAQEFRSAKHAPLILGISTALGATGLSGMLLDLAAQVPGVQLNLQLAPSAELIQSAVQGESDLILVADIGGLPARFDQWLLLQCPLSLALRRDHPMANHDRICLEDLSREALIHCNDDATELLVQTGRGAGVALGFRHRVAAFDQARGLMLAGLGCAVQPAGASLDPDLVAIPLDRKLPPLRIVIAAMSGRRRGPATEAFLRAARARDWSRV